MELYLDSANLSEIEEAQKLGYIYGLTTTPTFMHRDGVSNIDELVLKLAGMVPVLQVEALGNTSKEIINEAKRLLDLGLNADTTVFKIPVSIEGTKACNQLIKQGCQVNLHLIYTIQQAYMAMNAGATYICPLVGRLQDQGHDALSLVVQCVDAVNYYGYQSKVMFSSVRHPEHVRNALQAGAHACTIPWKVMKDLTSNHFTSLGTRQFVEHTHLITKKVADVIREDKATISGEKNVVEALVEMTRSKLGAVTVLNSDGTVHRIFTDGDLRRIINKNGEGVLQHPLSNLPPNDPTTIPISATLQEASDLFKINRVDTLIVVDGNAVVGMLDIQDLLI